MQPVSVIMATYNRAQYIRAALESILQQGYAPMEIIVVDDGSTDGTEGVISALCAETSAPIYYVRQSNQGLPAAHNHGLRLAQGEIITFLDSDDLWPPDRLPSQLAWFHPQNLSLAAPAIVLGRVKRFPEADARVNPQELVAFNDRPFHYALGSSLFRRHLFDEIGGFDETLLYTADWDWFMRARGSGVPMAVDPRITLLVRIHASNMTRDRAVGASFTAQMVRKHLERQRQVGEGKSKDDRT